MHLNRGNNMNYILSRDPSYCGSINPSQDDLKHHKYIKREKGKNGKWIYYYDKKQLKKDIKKSLDKTKDVLGFDELEALNRQHNKVMTVDEMRNASRAKYIMTMPTELPTYNNPKRKYTHQQAVTKRRYDKWNKKYDEEVDKYYKQEKSFHETPIGKIDKVIDKGKDIIEKILKRDIWVDFTRRR